MGNIYQAKDRPSSAVEALTERIKAMEEECKKAEEALAKSEERFRQVSEYAQEWIWEVDPTGLYTYASPVVEKVLGYRPEEIVGQKHFYDFFDPEIKKTLTEKAFAAFEKKEVFRGFENTNVHKDGHLVFLETSGSPILDEEGNLLGYRGLDIDVTLRKQAITQIRKSEERFRQLAENIDHVFWFIQLEPERVLYVSPAFEKIWGYATEDLYRNPKLWTETIHAEDRDEVRELFNACIMEADKFVTYDVEYRITRKDGNIRWIHDYGANYYGREGKLYSVSGIAEDITDRKQAEVVIRQMMEELDTRVAERTKELYEINKKLQRELGERRQIEQALKRQEKELRERSNKLESANIACEFVLKRIEKDKDDLEKNLLSNMKLLVMPYVDRLKKTKTSVQQDAYINVLEANLNNLVSPFSQKLSSKFLALTPREIRVAALVKEGKTSKEIAQILNLSKGTVDFHRDHIRIKLGIKNGKGNLRTHLLSIT